MSLSQTIKPSYNSHILNKLINGNNLFFLVEKPTQLKCNRDSMRHSNECSNTMFNYISNIKFSTLKKIIFDSLTSVLSILLGIRLEEQEGKEERLYRRVKT